MTAAITAFVGFNGGGKTLAMVDRLALPALAEGRPVVSNFRIGPVDQPGVWADGARALETWREIPDLRGCVLLLDEITACLPSRQSMSLPPELQRVLNQLRKLDVQLGWTAPNWARADRILREVTGSVTACKGMFPDLFARDIAGRVMRYDGNGEALPPAVGKVVRGRPGARVRWPNGWRPNRLFRWVTFAADDFEEFTIHASQKLRPMSRRWYWRARHDAHLSYSTLDEVNLLDHLDDLGTCVVCGGQRQRAKCRCREGGRVPAGGAPAPEPAPAGSDSTGVRSVGVHKL